MDTVGESEESMLSSPAVLKVSQNGSLNSGSDEDSVTSQNFNQHRDFNYSEDDDSCFENTIIELEDLIGNEEEFQSFINAMTGGVDPEALHSSSPILDMNSNVVKDKTVVQVIDIASDDESVEAEKVESFATPAHAASYSQQDSAVISSPVSFCPTSSDLLSLGVKDVSASYLNYGNKNKSPSLQVNVPKFSLNPLVLDTSEKLQDNATSNTHCKEFNNADDKDMQGTITSKIEEFKDSLLDENCNTLGYCTDSISINSPSPKTEELLLADSHEGHIKLVDSVISPNESNELTLPVSCIVSEDVCNTDIHTSSNDSVISPNESNELTLPVSCFVSEDVCNTDIHTSSNDSNVSVPEPVNCIVTEDISNTDIYPSSNNCNVSIPEPVNCIVSEDVVITSSKASDTSIPEPVITCAITEDVCYTDILTSSNTSNASISESVNCIVTEDVFNTDIHTSSNISNASIIAPVNCKITEDLEEKDTNSLSFYDNLDIEPFSTHETAESPIPLPSPPPQEFVDEVLSTLPLRSQYDVSVEQETQQSQEKLNTHCQSERLIPFLDDTEFKPSENVINSDVKISDGVSNYSDDSNSVPVQTSSQPVPSWQIPFISTDEAENADNNDPEWNNLGKLKTDAERYRVVREQWRQKEIPDPRRDLTCHNYRRNRAQLPGGSCRENHLNVRQSRKRTRSVDENDNECNPAKRRRMYSCTVLYDKRIGVLENQIENQFRKLQSSHARDLQKLSQVQQETQNSLYYSYDPYHPYQMNEIMQKHDMEIQDLNVRYDEKLHNSTKDKRNAIELLKKASQEVLAFNMFYNDLGGSNNNYDAITEEELDQFHEIENMYDMYNKIYSQAY